MNKYNKTIIGNSTLYFGNCLEVMKIIPDKSIDMILCDLPYGTTACKWDVIIPFEPLWEQYKRIIKDKGCIALFSQEPFSSLLRISNISYYKYDIIWKKNRPTNQFQLKNAFGKWHENINIFSYGDIAATAKNKMNYYPQGITKSNKIAFSVMNKNNSVHGYRNTKPYKLSNENYPCSVIEFKNEHGKLHPTQKPVALLEYLIKTYTLENETVLDNCMGSGSTKIACINTNRKFIGIEKDEKYFDIAKNRKPGDKKIVEKKNSNSLFY